MFIKTHKMSFEKTDEEFFEETKYSEDTTENSTDPYTKVDEIFDTILWLAFSIVGCLHAGAQ